MLATHVFTLHQPLTFDMKRNTHPITSESYLSRRQNSVAATRESNADSKMRIFDMPQAAHNTPQDGIEKIISIDVSPVDPVLLGYSAISAPCIKSTTAVAPSSTKVTAAENENVRSRYACVNVFGLSGLAGGVPTPHYHVSASNAPSVLPPPAKRARPTAIEFLLEVAEHLPSAVIEDCDGGIGTDNSDNTSRTDVTAPRRALEDDDHVIAYRDVVHSRKQPARATRPLRHGHNERRAGISLTARAAATSGNSRALQPRTTSPTTAAIAATAAATDTTAAATRFRHSTIPRCTICCDADGALFASWDEASEHVRTVHADVFSLAYREAWQAAHPGRYLAPCDMCGRHIQAGRANNANTHLKEHKAAHDVAQGRAYPCAFPGCNKSFTESRSLRVHAVVHDARLGLKCEVAGCAYTCGSPSDLRKHGVVHDRSRRLPCTECGITFSDRSNMRAHCKRAHGAGAVMGAGATIAL